MEKIISVFKEIKPILDSFDSFSEGGLCVVATRFGYAMLQEKGVNVLCKGGKAAFSVNDGANGFIDFGYNEDALSALGGNVIGHYWLEVDGKTIDYSLPYLKSLMLKDNKRRNIKDNRFVLDDYYIIKENSTYKDLFDGKIGVHYNAIVGMEEKIWKLPFPNFDDILETKTLDLSKLY